MLYTPCWSRIHNPSASASVAFRVCGSIHTHGVWLFFTTSHSPPSASLAKSGSNTTARKSEAIDPDFPSPVTSGSSRHCPCGAFCFPSCTARGRTKTDPKGSPFCTDCCFRTHNGRLGGDHLCEDVPSVSDSGWPWATMACL